MERRRPREHFTRVLTRICQRLDDSSVADVNWTDKFFREVVRCTVSVRGVWAVGSYARGALDCGDLDLVVEAASQSEGRPAGLPPTSAISRSFFGSPSDVRVYLGTPEDNTSGISLDDARMIWTSEGLDWAMAIENIRPDPKAGRFPRPTDSVPFRMEQLDSNIGAISELLELELSRTVQWRFVPMTAVGPAKPTSADEIDFYQLATYFCGSKTQRLLPHLLGAFQRKLTWPKGRWLRRQVEKTEFRWGNCDLLVGKPPVHISRLDALSTNELAIVPHLTQRGPNGIWFLGRGDEHPLVKRASDVRLFCLIDEDAQPIEIQCTESNGREGVTFDLFSNESVAANQAREDEKEFGEVTRVREVSGRDLLALLALADVLYLESGDIALTHKGQLLLDASDVKDADAVLARLLALTAS
jgi:hypothetical protein